MKPATVIRLRARPRPPVVVVEAPPPPESGTFPVERPRGWDARRVAGEVRAEFRRFGLVDREDPIVRCRDERRVEP